MPTILAPMVVDGRLENYAYITIVLKPAAPAGVLAIREKVPFLQDVFLRELNGATIVKADAPQSVDEGALKQRLIARMNQILPAGTVAELKFEPIVVAPVQALMGLYGALATARVSWRRIAELLETPPDVVSPSDGTPLGEVRGEIEFDRATGKLSETDYTALHAQYQELALEALRAEGTGDEGRGAGAAPTKLRPSAPGPRPVCPIDGPRPETNAVFCSACGRRLATAPGFCARCGTALEDGARFCARCGTRVAA